MTDTAYASLQHVLDNAFRQASEGKGKERHAEEGEPFEKQQIVEIGRRLQGNPAAGPLFQAVKKIYESGRLDDEKGIHELYGAINYIAAAIILRGGVVKSDCRLKIQQLKLAYVSTAHITEEDDRQLRIHSWRATRNFPPAIFAHDSGYFVFLAGDMPSGVSDSFGHLVNLARELGYDWLNLDSCGPVVSGLPQFSW